MKKKIIAVIMLISIAVIYYCMSNSVIKNPFLKNEEKNVYYGTVEAEEYNVSSEIPGKIEYLNVKEGQSIKKGMLIAKVEAEESKIKAEQADISVKNSKNELGKIAEGSRKEEIAAQRALVKQSNSLVKQGELGVKQAQNSYTSAKSIYEYRKIMYDRVRSLYDNGTASKVDVDSAKNQLDLASISLDNAKSAVQNASYQIEGFKAQMEASQKKLDLLVNGVTQRNKQTALYGVEQSKKSYDIANILLNKSSVVSYAGGIVNSINFKAGEYITPGSSIATIIDMNDLWLNIYVPEREIPNIKIGQIVSLKSDFLRDTLIKGKIQYISTDAEFTPVNVVTKEDREKLVFKVKVKIIDNTKSIKPGMLMDVKIN